MSVMYSRVCVCADRGRMLHRRRYASREKHGISTFQLCARDTKYMPWLACNTSPVNSDIERSRLFGRRLRCCLDVSIQCKRTTKEEKKMEKTVGCEKPREEKMHFAVWDTRWAKRWMRCDREWRRECTLYDSYDTHTRNWNDELREYAHRAPHQMKQLTGRFIDLVRSQLIAVAFVAAWRWVPVYRLLCAPASSYFFWQLGCIDSECVRRFCVRFLCSLSLLPSSTTILFYIIFRFTQ